MPAHRVHVFYEFVLLCWVTVITILGLIQPVGCRLNIPAWHLHGMELLLTWSPTSMRCTRKRITFPSLGIRHWDVPHVLRFIGFLIAMFIVFGKLHGPCMAKNGIWGARYLYLVLWWLFLSICCNLESPGEKNLSWVIVFSSLICWGLSGWLIGMGGSILLCVAPFPGPKFLNSMGEKWAGYPPCLDFLPVVDCHGIVRQIISSHYLLLTRICSNRNVMQTGFYLKDLDLFFSWTVFSLSYWCRVLRMVVFIFKHCEV